MNNDINWEEIPVVQWGVDASKYNTRPISSAFRGASEELKCLVLNLCLHPMLAVPMSKGYYPSGGTSYYGAKRALDALRGGGWIELALNYGTDIKRARVWRRTTQFEEAFRIRAGKRLLVREESLTRLARPPRASDREKGLPVSSVPGLETYARLIEGVRLSMSDGSQVFRDIDLYRKDGRRIYAHGAYNYQSGITKEERRFLLIDGESAAELDFPSMHANLLLNRAGQPCRMDVYEAVLREAGLEATAERRKAVKPLVNAAFNLRSPRGFAPMARRCLDGDGVPLIDRLGVSPSALRAAITKAHPALAPYVCRGDQSAWLQGRESEIMIGTLEALAKKGVVALPLHDSVVVPASRREVARAAMEESYRRKTTFSIRVK